MLRDKQVPAWIEQPTQMRVINSIVVMTTESCCDLLVLPNLLELRPSIRDDRTYLVKGMKSVIQLTRISKCRPKYKLAHLLVEW